MAQQSLLGYTKTSLMPVLSLCIPFFFMSGQTVKALPSAPEEETGKNTGCLVITASECEKTPMVYI